MFGTNNAASADGTAAPEYSPQQVAGAVSKLISATIGDCVVVFSRPQTQNHYSLTDIEWMVFPAAVMGQFVTWNEVSGRSLTVSKYISLGGPP
jgi:hemolysin-activating ACP:hemolysin acyltransferase